MGDAFGFEDTMFMDYNDTVKHYQKELGLDKDASIERAIQQGKKPNLHKRTPKNIKKKKNFIDRLILKEKGIDESESLGEDIVLDKDGSDKNLNPILIRNINSIKNMAKKQGLSTKQLLALFKDEL